MADGRHSAASRLHRCWSLALLACLLPGATQARNGGTDLVIKGSDTMVVLMKRWAQAYSLERPEISIQVTGGGTGTGVAALVNRTTSICMASRPIRTDEMEAAIKAFRKRPTRYEVALDAIVVYVHEDNPVPSLSLPQLAGIFTGQFLNWKPFGGPATAVTLYSRESSSGTYEFFKEHILDGSDFAARTQTMPGTAAVLAAVGRDPSGIGYGGVAFSTGVRVVPIRPSPEAAPVAPTREAVKNGQYPIWRHLCLYVNPALDHGAIAEFIAWIRGATGQQLAEELGYFPLPKPLGAAP